MAHDLRAEPLTPEGFAPFGAVIAPRAETATTINAGSATRFHALAEVAVDGAPAVLSIFRARPRPPVIDLLERHPHGSQAFVPLGARPWLTVVAEGPEGPLRAFLCGPGQGLQIARGVWHAPLITLAAQDFLVVDRDLPEANLETAPLDPPVRVTL